MKETAVTTEIKHRYKAINMTIMVVLKVFTKDLKKLIH